MRSKLSLLLSWRRLSILDGGTVQLMGMRCQGGGWWPEAARAGFLSGCGLRSRHRRVPKHHPLPPPQHTDTHTPARHRDSTAGVAPWSDWQSVETPCPGCQALPTSPACLAGRQNKLSKGKWGTGRLPAIWSTEMGSSQQGPEETSLCPCPALAHCESSSPTQQT